MPELPEVETVVRTLRPSVEGARVLEVELLRSTSIHPLSLPLERLTGQVIGAVTRRGKLVLLQMTENAEDPLYLAVHLRMTGRLMRYPLEAPCGSHTRCRFILARDAQEQPSHQLFFDDVRAFGVLFLGQREQFARWSFWNTLGPEPLSLTEEHFAARLHGKRAIKASLLDQTVMAGVGNIYADEALFRAGIDPRSSTQAVGRAAAPSLLAALQEVLLLSIEQCGSSIRDYRDANGNVGAFQNSFAVYGRGGLPCQRCGKVLHKERVAGRTTVFCSQCQQRF